MFSEPDTCLVSQRNQKWDIKLPGLLVIVAELLCLWKKGVGSMCFDGDLDPRMVKNPEMVTQTTTNRN